MHQKKKMNRWLVPRIQIPVNNLTIKHGSKKTGKEHGRD